MAGDIGERLKDLERKVNKLEQDVRELASEKARQRDQEKHEWRGMLDSAVRVLTHAFEGQLDPLKPLLSRLQILEEMNKELQAAREERIARKAKEEARDEVEVRRKADAKRRNTVIGIMSPIVVAVIAALASMIVSQCQRKVGVYGPTEDGALGELLGERGPATERLPRVAGIPL